MLGLLTASYTGASLWHNQRQAAVVAARAGEHHGPRVNPFAAENGKNLIAYVITASDCGWSTLPATMNAVGSIREKLRAAHGATYASVSVVAGITQAAVIDQILTHLGTRIAASGARPGARSPPSTRAPTPRGAPPRRTGTPASYPAT